MEVLAGEALPNLDAALTLRRGDAEESRSIGQAASETRRPRKPSFAQRRSGLNGRPRRASPTLGPSEGSKERNPVFRTRLPPESARLSKCWSFYEIPAMG